MNSDCKPMNWGWGMRNGLFLPIMMDAGPGPQDLLEIIQCNCKETCDKQCSCQKAGLKGSSLWGECLSVFVIML